MTGRGKDSVMGFEDYGAEHRAEIIRDYSAEKAERIVWAVFATALVGFALFFAAWIVIIPTN